MFSDVLAFWELERGAPDTPTHRRIDRSISSFSYPGAYVIDPPLSLFQTVSEYDFSEVDVLVGAYLSAAGRAA